MKYLNWGTSFKLYRTRFGKYILKVNTNDISNGNELLLNDTAYKVISSIDGTKSYAEVIDELSNYYDEDKDIVQTNVKLVIDNLKKRGINLEYSDYPIRLSNANVEEVIITPTVASIEITNACNLKCRHCYGKFGEKVDKIDIVRLKHLLDDLDNLGIKIIELTGGDISVYPNLYDLIEYSLQKNFQQISLLTNGHQLDSSIKEIIIKNKERIFMQIDLHSMDEEYNKWFTKSEGYSTDLVKSNIKFLTSNGVGVRVAMIVTPRNITDIREVADWSFKIGAKKLGISPVVPIGRARSINNELTINSTKQLDYMEKELENINKKYPNFIAFNEEGLTRQVNCGCLTSHVVIDTYGNIKLCTMDSLSYANTKLGNVFDKKIIDLYREKEKIVEAIFNLQVPNREMKSCSHCDNLYFCEKCILRALVSKFQNTNLECIWYEENVPSILKKEWEKVYS